MRRLIVDENGASVSFFFKSVDMKVVVNLVSESWEEIEGSTFANHGERFSVHDQQQETVLVDEQEDTNSVEEFVQELDILWMRTRYIPGYQVTQVSSL